jgi:hypothetical protein
MNFIFLILSFLYNSPVDKINKYNLSETTIIKLGEKPPKPTEEVNKLISQLGDDDFDIRNTAHQKLIDMKYQSFKACYENQNNKDFEISFRCQEIVKKYQESVFSIKTYPSIYLLPNKNRFPLGVKYQISEEKWFTEMNSIVDIGYFYYQRAKSIYNNGLDVYRIIDQHVKRNPEIEANAMKLYVEDMIYFGKTKEEIKAIIDEANNSFNLMNMPLALESYYESIPGPTIKKD